MSAHVYDNEILPNKFTIYRKDRESRGGGVLIAVNDLLPSMLIPSPPNLEVVCIKLCLSGDHIISLCSVYVPPNPDITYFNQLIAFLKFLAANEEIIIIVGDFNLPDIILLDFSFWLFSTF